MDVISSQLFDYFDESILVQKLSRKIEYVKSENEENIWADTQLIYLFINDTEHNYD